MNRDESSYNKKNSDKKTKKGEPIRASSPLPAKQKQTLTIQQAIGLAIQNHQAGDLPKAESIYQQILRADPNQPIALHLLGVVAHQVGKNDISVNFITKAIVIEPDYAEAHSNLGNTLKALGKLDEAVASYNKAIAIKPDYAEAYSNHGAALQELGKFDEAAASFSKAIAIKPDYAEAYSNLGLALQELGKLKEAITAYSKALAIKPNYAEAHCNLGNALKDLGKLDEAVNSFVRALKIMPGNAKTSIALSHALYTISITDLDQAQKLALNFTEAFPKDDVLRRGISGITKNVNYSTETERLYTTSVFDNFAKTFDKTLDKLSYDMPEKIAQAAYAVDGRSELDVLDAGCGTGLCGTHLRARARHLVGVDLSANMLSETRKKRLYDKLVVSDLVYFMANKPLSFDLVVSADVLNYIGDITPLAQAAYLALRPGGVCAVSIESLNDDVGSPFLLAPNGRYQHTSQYVHEIFTNAGFVVDPLQKTSVRVEYGIPVNAWIVIAQK
jgi:predicted TPR repeat methyltransferase